MISGPDQAQEAASKIPAPYAAKVVAEDISHKSDVGGVILGLSDGAACTRAVEDIQRKFGQDKGFQGIILQQMVPKPPGSFEMIIGAKRDPQFGPVVMLGHGGIFVEVIGKTSLRIAPLPLAEIELMIDELPGSELLKGVRGLPPADREALVDAINRVGHLMVEHPEISSIDINPILVSASGAVALDTRLFLNESNR